MRIVESHHSHKKNGAISLELLSDFFLPADDFKAAYERAYYKLQKELIIN